MDKPCALHERLRDAETADNQELKICLDYLLGELANMSLPQMQSLTRSVRAQMEKVPRQFSASVAVVGGDPTDLRDELRTPLASLASDADPLFDEIDFNLLAEEAEQVCEAANAVRLRRERWQNLTEVITPSSLDEFLDMKFFDLFENGGTYFFYYTGHGVEMNGHFYFILGQPKTLLSCLQLDVVVERSKRFYGCTFIFCINSCRTPLKGAFVNSLRTAFANKPGKSVSFNNYVLMFPTASGVAARDGQETATFQQTVIEMIPRLAGTEELTEVLTDFACKFSPPEQDPPSVYFFPSDMARPPTTGYTLLWDHSHKDMQRVLGDETIQVFDRRMDHRRRVNRMAAPTLGFRWRRFLHGGRERDVPTYINIHAYIYIYIYEHTYTCIYIYIHIHIYIYIYAHIHACIHTYLSVPPTRVWDACAFAFANSLIHVRLRFLTQAQIVTNIISTCI